MVEPQSLKWETPRWLGMSVLSHLDNPHCARQGVEEQTAEGGHIDAEEPEQLRTRAEKALGKEAGWEPPELLGRAFCPSAHSAPHLNAEQSYVWVLGLA